MNVYLLGMPSELNEWKFYQIIIHILSMELKSCNFKLEAVNRRLTVSSQKITIGIWQNPSRAELEVDCKV